MYKLDGKFYGRIWREKDGSEVPPDQFIVFLARDRALIPTLEYYRTQCELLGCGIPQLMAVNDLLCRVQQWQTDHPDQMKVPDVDPGEISVNLRAVHLPHSPPPQNPPKGPNPNMQG
jgi:hypothetical protein